MRRILIADPHPIVRLGIKERLTQMDPKCSIVAQIASEDQLLPKLLQKQPNLLIWEFDMLELADFSVIRDISEKLPLLKICIFTVLPQDIYEHQCLRHGAHAFLPKDVTLRKFNAVIQELLTPTPSKNTSIRPKRRRRKIGTFPLSAREVQVLEHLVKGCRNKDIAANLNLDQKTVSTYKSRILAKLEVENLADLIQHYTAVKQ